MVSGNLSLPSTDDDQIINVSLPTTPIVNKEQLKLKSKLATIDDVGSKTRYGIKEKINEIKKLLGRRTDRYKVVAHGVDRSHLTSWWSKFGFAKETIHVSDEAFSVSNFVSCQYCFTTYRYGLSSTESTSRHKCDGAPSSLSLSKFDTLEYSFKLIR